MKKVLLFIPFLGVLIVLSLFYMNLKQNPYLIPSVMINKKVPSLDAPLLLAPTKHFEASTLKGHASLVNVFASWCYSCLDEHKLLMTIAKSHQVNLYGINYKDTPKAAKALLTKYGNPYKQIISDSTGKIGINLGVYGTPETFLIDKKGIIRDKIIGPITKTTWRHRLLPEIKRYQ